eukprot:TRINITY_DN7201_c0_g1_i1.p1 TRINITY_DN7201_c0_g1~~TRINITY_DN7201_c0_g1_i1.p1  ORF type:complete len:295 (+),score=71.31 TRINITY_DN7201_c0_g1_i1:142-1026(+)
MSDQPKKPRKSYAFFNHASPESAPHGGRIPPGIITFISGGIAGTVTKTIGAPLERVKILFQIRSKSYPTDGIGSTFKQIITKEGVLSLWKGNTATVTRIFPYAAIQFFAYEKYREILKRGSMIRIPTPIRDLTCGSLAGATSVIMTYPLDLIRVRMAVVAHRPSGIIQTASSIIHHEGFLGLFRGISPTLLGILPYAGVNFATFEGLKNFAVNRYGWNSKEIPIPAKLACGAIAGAFGQTVAYPLDVVRRVMQTATTSEGSPIGNASTWQVIKHIVHKEGRNQTLIPRYPLSPW